MQNETQERGELSQDNKELKNLQSSLSIGTGVITSKLGVDDSLPSSRLWLEPLRIEI